MQSKKANFDASHELEELLLEDNPLKARQRKVQDLSNLTSEMRQMEEQYVHAFFFGRIQLTIRYPSYYRFTTYDFKKMARRSYFPQNQRIGEITTASSSTGVTSRPVTPLTDVGQAESALNQKLPRQSEHRTPDSETIPMGDMNEKAYAI